MGSALPVQHVSAVLGAGQTSFDESNSPCTHLQPRRAEIGPKNVSRPQVKLMKLWGLSGNWRPDSEVVSLLNVTLPTGSGRVDVWVEHLLRYSTTPTFN